LPTRHGMLVRARDEGLAAQELLAELRVKNKELQESLGAAQKTAKEAQLRRTTGRDATKVSAHLLAIRTQHDTLKHRAQQLAKEYRLMRNELQMLSREETAQTQDNPEAKRIRQLENRLDKTMIKFNEAQSIRKTYDQIVRRLREERVGFDTQLAAMEKSLNAKRTDLEELKSLSQEASHAKDVALSELEKTKSMALAQKEKRLKELRDKRGMAAARAKMNEAAREREASRQDLVLAVHGDMDEDAEAKLQASVEDQQREKVSIQEQASDAKRRVEKYEAAFQKIREATGVKDESEVIQKIVSQKEQHHSLQQLTKDNAQRVDELNRELEELKDHLDALKFSGGDARSGNRQLIDSLEAQLKTAMKDLASSKDRFDRIARTQVELRAGTEHLHDKVSGLKNELRMMGVAPASVTPVVSSDAGVDTEVLSLLDQSEAVMLSGLAYLQKFAKRYITEAEERAISADGSARLDLPAAIARAIAPTADALKGITAVSLGSDVAAQLGLEEEAVVALKAHNLRVGVTVSAAKRGTSSVELLEASAVSVEDDEGKQDADASLDGSGLLLDMGGDLGAGDEDGTNADLYEEHEAVSHEQVKREAAQTVKAYQGRDKVKRRTKTDTELPRYLE
jgi:hypothetical protein